MSDDLGDYRDDDDDLREDDEETAEERDAAALRYEKLRLDLERVTALGYTANDLKWFFCLVMVFAWFVPPKLFAVLAAAFAAALVTWIARAVRILAAYVNGK